jgi:hypothetical protein
MTTERHVHDQVASPDIQSRPRRATINGFISLVGSDSDQVVNFLDIGLQGLRTNLGNDGLEDGENMASVVEKNMIFRSPWPDRHLSWALLGRKCSVTRSHMDAAGFCTRVRVIKGQKLWMSALVDRLPTNEGFSNDIRWQALVLSEGDDL